MDRSAIGSVVRKRRSETNSAMCDSGTVKKFERFSSCIVHSGGAGSLVEKQVF
jgi:hypothetical protein